MDILQHPQTLPLLLHEIDQNWLSNDLPNLQAMPLLDSVLQESARTNASETSKPLLLYPIPLYAHRNKDLFKTPVTLRRTAVTNYTFSDGLAVKRGDILCAPLRAMGLSSPSPSPHPPTTT